MNFLDSESLSDLRRFLERGERIGASSVRLQALGAVLVSTVPVLAPKGLGDSTPLILGLRTQAIGPGEDRDVVVSIRSVRERIARMESAQELALDWPPVTLTESWAGMAPPQRGWERSGTVPVSEVAERADAVLAPLAQFTTTQPEAVLQSALRADAHAPLGPAGVAAAAQTLGFLVGSEPAVLARAARWSRLST
ncbi:MAG TPA: hypothetical protein VK139_07295, partial [Microbacteriaceae bacterium]|nr:hypothetical protein [Microbacteriaceae bacterium]